ncbi:MAG: (4Fe-4S)-binding protein, partial [Paracoccaceae bacterium]|nr:(4Fe-4S)-binding protein [Paracoccaceae bacterium]
MAKHLILCDCMGSQKIDAPTLQRATGLRCSRIHTALCTTGIEAATQAITAGDALIACAQEAPRFTELAEDLGAEPPVFIDIRDRAGWTDDHDTGPKMAALLAEGLLPAQGAKTLDVLSEGIC